MNLLNFFKRGALGKKASFGGGQGYTGGDSFTRDVDVSGSAYSLPYMNIRSRDAGNCSIVATVLGWGMRNIVQARPTVKREDAQGNDEIEPKHPVTALIRSPQALVRPEDRLSMNYRRMLQLILWSLMFDGNAYLLKVRNGSKVIGLDFIPHDAITVEERPNYPMIIDGYKLRGQSGRIPKEDVVHIMDGVDPDHPSVGLSKLKSVMRLVMTDNQIAIFAHAILRNPFPGIVMMPDSETTSFLAEDLQTIVEQTRQVSGGERGGGIAAFTQKMKVEKLGYSPNDMAVSEFAKLGEERITAVFGLPAIVAGMGAGLERSTFANYEQAREAATEEFLVPIWEAISAAFTDQLLNEYESDLSGVRVDLDYSKVKALQEDVDELHARTRENFKANMIDRERAKQMIGEEPGPEDKGVFFYMLRQPIEVAMPPPSKGASARQQAEGAA